MWNVLREHLLQLRCVCTEFCQQQRGPAFLYGGQSIVDDELVSRGIGDDGLVCFVDFPFLTRIVQASETRINEVADVLGGCFLAGCEAVADRTELHEHFGLHAIISLRGGGEPVHIFCCEAAEHPLCRLGGSVVAFVHDYHSVAFDYV